MSNIVLPAPSIDAPASQGCNHKKSHTSLQTRLKHGLAGLTLLGSASVANADGLPDFSTLVEQQGQSVVSVSIVRESEQNVGAAGRRGSEGIPGLERLPDELRRFFEQNPDSTPSPRAEPGRGIGSGFIISEDGYIVTNAHVVDGASSVTITLQDRQEFNAELIGQDDATDLALLKVDANDLPAVEMGDSDEVKVGQWVLAIGSPFGLDNTATQGIISAVARNLPSGSYTPFIQTDVAVNPGNSGGPLFDTNGVVIGVNSQIYSRSGGYQGLSFAIPINVTKRVIEQLKTQGYASRGWLGVAIQDVNQALANAFGLDTPYGALVSQVSPDGPAKAAGIQAGDIIIEFDAQRVNRSGDLPNLVGKTATGSESKVTLLRDGKEYIIDVLIGEFDRPDKVAAATMSDKSSDRFGLVVGALTDDLRDNLNIDGGVLVRKVTTDSAGYRAGIRAQDVIVSINSVELNSVSDFNAQLKGLDAGTTLPVLIQRGQSSQFLALEVPGPQG